MSKRLNIICFSLVCVIIAYTEIRKCQSLPFPSRFIYTALAFLLTDVLGMFTPPLATTVTVGFTVAALVGKKHLVPHCGQWSPSGQPQDTAFLAGTDATTGQPPSEALLSQPPPPGSVTV